MTFIAESLGSWLIGQLAGSAWRRISDWFLGSEQERALRAAGDAAIARAAEGLLPGGEVEQVNNFYRVVDQVFESRWAEPGELTTPTLLESLQVSLREQLAVLGDTSLTGTGTSAAAALGLSVDLIAETLTRELIQQILMRGTAGGPLAALANQLNHDITHLQGERAQRLLEHLVGELDEVRGLSDPPGSGRTLAPWTGKEIVGAPLAEVDPIDDLEIHPVIAPEVSLRGHVQLSALPPYVGRAHDVELRQIVESAQSRSRAVFLVADSSAGKTRALWEAIRHLPPSWLLWRPFTREELLEAIADRRVSKRTVIWLNETQRFLNTAGDAARGEHVAVAVMRLLRDVRISPVLVVGTFWREHITILTDIPTGDAEDLHEQARSLLKNQMMAVPEEFDEDALKAANAVADTDVRLAEALGRGEPRVAQYLAGARELVARYDTAPIEVRALIEAAVDLARLGDVARIPEGWLSEVSETYIPSDHWCSQTEERRDSWFRKALEYAGRPCRGVPGPLTLLRDSAREAPAYKVSDYLRRHLGDARAYSIPPPVFWPKISRHITVRDDLQILGTAAGMRGHLRHAETYRVLSYLHPPPDGDVLLRGMLERRLERGDFANAEPLARVVSAFGDPTAWGETIEGHARHGSWPGSEAMIRLGARASSADDWRNAVFAAEQAGQASASYGLALAAEELGANIWTTVVQDALGRGDLELAERSAANAGRLRDPGGWLAVAEFHREGDRPADAEAAAVEAARLGHPEELEALVRRHAASSKWDEANRLAAADGSARGWLHVADAQLAHGLFEECDMSLEQAIRTRDDCTWAAIAQLRLGQLRWSAAAHAAKSAIADDQAFGWEMLALVRTLAGDPDKAREAVANSSQVGQWLALAFALRADRTDEAEQACQEAAEQGDPHLWQVLAELREIDGDERSARKTWLEAARSGIEVAWTNAIALAFDAGEREDAKAIAREALENGRPEGWLQYVRRIDLLGDAEESLHAARAAVAAGVNTVWLRLSQWRIERGDVAGACSIAEEDDTDECSRWLAVCRFNDDDIELAEALAERAAERGHPGVWASLAEAAEQQRPDSSLAFQFWRAAAKCAESAEPNGNDRDGGDAASLWQNAVRAALRLEDFACAQQIAERVGGPVIWHTLALGCHHLQSGTEQYQHCVQVEQRALEQGDGSAYARLPSALIKAGRLDDAEQAARVAAEKGMWASWSELVVAYDSVGRSTDAERVARARRDADVWGALARRRFDAGDASGADQARKAGRALGRFPDLFTSRQSSTHDLLPEEWTYGVLSAEEQQPFSDDSITLRRWGIEPDGHPATSWSLNEPLAAVLCTISRRALARGECSAAFAVAREAIALDPTSHDAQALDRRAQQELRRLITSRDTTPLQEPHRFEQSQGLSVVPIKFLMVSTQGGSERSVLIAHKDGLNHPWLQLDVGAESVHPAGESRHAARFQELVVRSRVDRIARIELMTTDLCLTGGRIRLRDGRHVDVRGETALRLALATEKEVVAPAPLLSKAEDSQPLRGGDSQPVAECPGPIELPEALSGTVLAEIATAWPVEGLTVTVHPIGVNVRADQSTWLELIATDTDKSLLIDVDPPEAQILTQILLGSGRAYLPDRLYETTALLDAFDVRVQRVTILRPTDLLMSALVVLSTGELLNASVSIAVCLAQLSEAPIEACVEVFDSGTATAREGPDRQLLKTDAGGFNHYSQTVASRDGRARGRPIIGLCGWAWIPERTRSNEIPTCPDCMEIHRNRPPSRTSQLGQLVKTLGGCSRSLESRRRFAAAIDCRRQQLILLRALDAYQPDRYLGFTADAIEALASDHEAAGNPAAALEEWRRASELWSRLNACDSELRARKRTVAVARLCAHSDTHEFRRPLAEALRLVAVLLDRLERYDESAAARLEELAIRRDLDDGSFESKGALANALFQAGRTLLNSGRRDASVAMSLESAEVWQALRAQHPATGAADHAMALADAAFALRELGRPEDALPHVAQAVTIYRELGTRNTLERANLALMLSEHVDDLLATGHDAQARLTLEELVRIRRRLVVVPRDVRQQM